MVLENGSTKGTSALKRASAEREKIADKLYRSIHAKLETQQTQINENNMAREKYATVIRNMKGGGTADLERYATLQGAHGDEASEKPRWQLHQNKRGNSRTCQNNAPRALHTAGSSKGSSSYSTSASRALSPPRPSN